LIFSGSKFHLQKNFEQRLIMLRHSPKMVIKKLCYTKRIIYRLSAGEWKRFSVTKPALLF